jgi:hypothetical protein
MDTPSFASGSVSDAPEGAKPRGYMWDTLAAALEAKCEDTLTALMQHAERHGYAPDGQLRRAIADALSSLRGS